MVTDDTTHIHEHKKNNNKKFENTSAKLSDAQKNPETEDWESSK